LATDHPAVVVLTAVLQEASDLLRLPLTEIAVQSLQARDWPDGCLGLPGQGCAEVITPGFRVVLGPPADVFAWRTDQQGKIRREPVAGPEVGDLAVDYGVSGGLTGHASSELHLNTATMPPAEAEELKRLVLEADFWNIPTWMNNGDPIPDGYSYGVSVTAGSRRHGVNWYDGSGNGLAPYPAFGVLVAWLGSRAPSPTVPLER
jgi:hypothetical protein